MSVRWKIELNILVLTIILFFQRMAFPYMNYIFIPLVSGAILYFSIKLLLKVDKQIILRFIKIFFPYLLLVLFFFFVIVFGKDHNILIIKDLFQAVLVMILLLICAILIGSGSENIKSFTKYFVLQVIITSGLISMGGLLKFIIILSGFIPTTDQIPLFNTSLNIDYNFYCLSAILGIISVLFVIFTFPVSRRIHFFLEGMLFLFSLNVIFSNSRRGFVFYVFFFGVMLIVNVFSLLKKRFSQYETLLFIGLKIVFILSLIIYISTYNSKLFFRFKTSTISVNFIINALYPESYRYASIFGASKEDIDRRQIIKPDPRYPYTMWGTRRHKEVYPLTGENADIVPAGTVGYKLDSTCNASTWNGNAFATTLIRSLFSGDTINDKSRRYYASVFCYISDDFSGSWARIAAEGNAKGNLLGIYDLSQKGRWQKLEVDFDCEKGIAPVHLYMAKIGATDFRNLKGYVIFAYPEYGKLQSDMELSHTVLLKNEYLIKASVFALDQFKNIIADIKTRFFAATGDQDEIKMKSTDITIARKERWVYSLYLYKNEYSITQKIFGNGFDYMKKFGERFGESELDYPHNPFIDAFLYSGLIGGLIYLWFMLLVFYYYIKYLKIHLYFFISFIIVFLFSFVSANTHFSIPVFTFLSLVPFLTRYCINRNRS